LTATYTPKKLKKGEVEVGESNASSVEKKSITRTQNFSTGTVKKVQRTKRKERRRNAQETEIPVPVANF